MITFSNTWRFIPLFLLAMSVSVSVTAGGIATGLIFLATMAVLVRDRSQVVLPEKPILLALGALFGTYFLATLFSNPYPHDWTKFYEELWIKLLLVAVPILAGRDTRKLVWALKVALLFGGITAAYAIVQHFLGVDPIRDRSLYRPQFGHSAVTGFFSHHLSFAGQSIVFIIMTAAWYLDKPADRRHRWLLLMFLVMGIALMLSFARSAWVGVLIGLPVLVMLHSGRARWFGGIGGVLGVVGVLLIPPVRVHFLRIFQIQQHAPRLNLWETSWLGIKANPLLGFGPGNFKYLLEGFKVPGHYESVAHSHNDFLMHGVNAGMPGILAALALLWVTIHLMIKASRHQSDHQWIFRGIIALQVGMATAGFFQVFQTDDEVEMLLYFFLGCAVALTGGLGQEKNHSQSKV